MQWSKDFKHYIYVALLPQSLACKRIDQSLKFWCCVFFFPLFLSSFEYQFLSIQSDNCPDPVQSDHGGVRQRQNKPEWQLQSLRQIHGHQFWFQGGSHRGPHSKLPPGEVSGRETAGGGEKLSHLLPIVEGGTGGLAQVAAPHKKCSKLSLHMSGRLWKGTVDFIVIWVLFSAWKFGHTITTYTIGLAFSAVFCMKLLAKTFVKCQISLFWQVVCSGNNLLANQLHSNCVDDPLPYISGWLS